MLEPHFIPRGQTITGKFYSDMLESSVFPQIYTCMGAEEWVFMQDLARPRDCPYTTERIKAEGVKLLPRMPAGVHLNPLDVYVNNHLKKVLKNKDRSAIQKLKSETAIALRKMSKSKKVLGKIAKTCRAFPKRARWVAENFGKKVTRKKANETAKGNEIAPKNDVARN